MNPTLTMILFAMLPSLLMMGAAALVAAAFVVWLRDRARLRRAGVSADSPGCPRCLYIVRGWPSPICPECGADVRATGVCVRPRVPRWLRVAAIASGAAATCLVVCMLLLFSLFQRRVEKAIWRYQSAAAPLAYEFDLRTQRELGWPRGEQWTTILTIDAASTLGNWRITAGPGHMLEAPAPADGMSGSSWQQVWITRGAPLPRADEVAQMIADATGADVTQQASADAISAQAATIADLIAQSRMSGGAQLSSPLAVPANQFQPNSSGWGTHRDVWRPAQVAALIVPFLIALLAARWAWRRHRLSVRPAREAEWSRALAGDGAGRIGGEAITG